MELNVIYNEDCLITMKRMADKSVDLILTDPPYGLGNRLSDGGGKLKNTPMAVLYRATDWEDIKPTKEVFDEIFRVSKNQIIFGGNYFEMPPTRCVLAWDKKQYMPTLSAWEYAWTSFDKPAKIFRYSSTDLNRQHPTQKPLELFRDILYKYSQENEIVYDPFLGSGTTALACKQLNRNYIGSELDKGYYDISLNRIANAQQTLL